MTMRLFLLTRILLAAGLFIVLHFLSSLLALSCIAKIEVDARFEQSDSFQAYYTVRGAFTDKQSVRTPSYQPGTRMTTKIDLKNHIVRKLRMDPGQQAGKVDVFAIRLLSFFGPPLSLGPQQISQLFTASGDIASMRVVDDHVEIIANGPDPQLVCLSLPRFEHIGISWFLPAITTLAFILLFSQADWAAFPAFRDITNKSATTGANIDALDGVRGFAALLVLAEHSGYHRFGAFGVLLFFALSGFLLATPFVKQAERAISFPYMRSYLTRRLKRILPMFYLVVTILFLFRGDVAPAFRHYVFLQGDGILWTVMQETFFYLILPVVMFLLYVCCRDRRGLAIVLLSLLVISANHWLTTDVIAFYGMGRELPARVGVFLSGVLFAYVYHWVENNPALQRHAKIMNRLGATLGLLLFAGIMLQLVDLVPWPARWNLVHRGDLFGFLCGLLLLLITLAQHTWMQRIVGCYPLRAIGLVGYSYYLLHSFAITVVKSAALEFFAVPNYSGPGLFLAAGLITYGLSIFTYTYIERPFIRGSAA